LPFVFSLDLSYFSFVARFPLRAQLFTRSGFFSAWGVAGPHELGSDQIPHRVPAAGVASRLDFCFRSPLRSSVSVPRSCCLLFKALWYLFVNLLGWKNKNKSK
jgi:hypothetical protein